MAHFARDEGVNLKLQLLVVPATDMRYCLRHLTLDNTTCPYQSVLSYHDVPWGPLAREQWFLKYWLGENDGKMIFDLPFRLFYLRQNRHTGKNP